MAAQGRTASSAKIDNKAKGRNMPKWRGQLVPGVHFSFMIHAGKESTSLSSNELSPRSATLTRKRWGRGGDARARCVFARSQNWVNCRRVKRSQIGKQTHQNSHVQTLRVSEREAFLLSSRDYPDSTAVFNRSQVPSNCPEVALLIIEELNGNVFDRSMRSLFSGKMTWHVLWKAMHKQLTSCKSMHFAFSQCSCGFVTLEQKCKKLRFKATYDYSKMMMWQILIITNNTPPPMHERRVFYSHKDQIHLPRMLQWCTNRSFYSSDMAPHWNHSD